MQILLANPRGFCAGVDRAISIVENALAIYGAPIYVRHEVVHNRYVVDSLRERGAIFIEQISEVPDGAILIFSAHGVSQAVRNEAKSRDLTVFDYIKVMTNGGPAQSTEAVGLLIYRHAINEGKFSTSVAESMILFVIVGVVSAFSLRLTSNKQVGE